MGDLKKIVRNGASCLYRHISRNWKRARFVRFLELVRPEPGDVVLDLGGGSGAFFHDNIDLVRKHSLRVVVADISEKDLLKAERRGFGTVRLPEQGLQSFGDRQFAVIFCNSVIEHVTLPKDEIWEYTKDDFREKAFAAQKKFAAGIERVGVKYFVQTPCVHFPLESHTWLPAFYAYPRSRSVHVARLKNISKYWIKSTTPDFNLLDEAQMRVLFPDAREILCNRVCGFPKELIAYRGSWTG